MCARVHVCIRACVSLCWHPGDVKDPLRTCVRASCDGNDQPRRPDHAFLALVPEPVRAPAAPGGPRDRQEEGARARQEGQPRGLLHDGLLYFLKSNNGILTSLDADSGALHYGPERLAGIRSVYASPVVARDRLYVTSREGTTVVVRTGPTLEILATNTLDDEFDASAAMVDGELYLRGARALYCIAED